MKLAHILAIVPVLGAVAYAQPTSVSIDHGMVGSYSATFSSRPRHVTIVTGAPYSAEQVSEHIQTLADGTHIVQPARPSQTMYRDSQGRTRTERQMMAGPNHAGPTIVEIADPVAGYSYTLDSANRVAHRAKVEATPVPRSVRPSLLTTAPLPVNPQQPARPDVQTESLGTQMIEGVQADGHRTTMTWPVGSVGNDRPIVAINEVWTSTDLHVVVLSKNNDPRSGESTTKLIHISRTEPDPSLFQPPADYSIVDEEGSFTINSPQPVR